MQYEDSKLIPDQLYNSLYLFYASVEKLANVTGLCLA